jgi:asparagine synthase (glutamine-hydrolysing)
MLRGVRQLEPGQWLRVQVGSREVYKQVYWDVDYSQRQNISLDDAASQFSDLLGKAVRRRLMADVPLGAFLSGGVDSSAVVACMTDSASQVKTFSMGFGERSFNEAPFAAEVAAHLKTQHHEKIVTPDLAHILPKIVWHGEDPLADSSMIPVYYLSQMTREHVIVALAGDGADEILAGYPTYIATRWARRLQFLPHGAVQGAMQPVLNRLPLSDDKISRREKMQRFANGIGLPWRDAHAVWRRIHSEDQKRQVLADGVLNGRAKLFDTYQQYYGRCQSDDMLDQLLYVDTRFYLPNDMLVKVDRMSMAHGLEARVPFLDHELVEFAATLPPEFKLSRGVGKFILRHVMADRLPPTTLTRPKEGFNIPVSKWLREDLFELMTDTLAENRLREVGIWKPDGVQAMIRQHRERQQDNGHQLWGILTFMLWWEQFIQ